MPLGNPGHRIDPLDDGRLIIEAGGPIEDVMEILAVTRETAARYAARSQSNATRQGDTHPAWPTGTQPLEKPNGRHHDGRLEQLVNEICKTGPKNLQDFAGIRLR